MRLDSKLIAKIREVFEKYEDQHADHGWQELRKKYPTRKSLTEKIHEVFEKYEDEYADYGWQELRKKYPVKRHRKPLVLWWLSAAAAVLILAVGVWIAIPEDQQQSIVSKTDEKSVIQHQSENPTPKYSGENNPTKTAIQSEIDLSLEDSKHLATSKAMDLFHSDKERNGLYSKKHQRKEILLTPNEKKSGDPLIYPDKNDQLKGEGNILSPQNAVIAQKNSPQNDKSFEEENGNVPAIAQIKNNQLPDSSSNTNEAISQPDNAVAKNSSEKKRTLADLALEENAKKKKEEKKKDKKVIFGLYAGSFVSYAAGSENKVNLGAGFSSDIALTKNLKLSTGIALAQNQLSYNNSKYIPLSAQESFHQSIQKPSKTDATGGAQTKGFAPTINVISYNLKYYEARLLGLDIPVSLKYSFFKNKNEYFLSAGFSSGTFLNESYMYKYSSSGPSYEKLPDTEPVLNEGTSKVSFGSFDFARMLNFSFGVGYPLGKQNKLIIEPFLNYPIKEVGAENLRFGSGGVNLKLNFQSFKSKKK